MNHIFVFGSNLAGRHGRGAALYARQHHGAVYGVGEGLSGNSYGIPTKDFNIQSRSLNEVTTSIYRFIDFAIEHPELTFEVTKVGCGLAGFTETQIAPLFKDAPTNCNLPEEW
tara:strand:- start:55 stop:393 length:339 start_codon:yes stop_codon:yes gene_type:complete